MDLALVEPKLMTADEIAWLDRYHARVREVIRPLVDNRTRQWLERATKAIAG
jgi:Xaa-Pro aminopeptidase